MPAPDHGLIELYITQMVYNRLPFLAVTPANDEIISMFILEVMYELEMCFRVDENLPEGDPSNIGKEEVYSMPQRAVIADVVAVNILVMKIAANMGGLAVGAEDGTNNSKFLSRTKAGSVEVEWEQFDTKKGGGLFSSAETLLKLYQSAASRKAGMLGCGICWDLAGMTISCGMYKEVAPFIVVSHSCPPHTNVIERG